MKRISQYMEDIFTEAALAEERDMRNRGQISGRSGDLLDSLFTAITFAEAGEFDTARDMMGSDRGNEGHGPGCCAPGFCPGRA